MKLFEEVQKDFSDSEKKATGLNLFFKKNNYQ